MTGIPIPNDLYGESAFHYSRRQWHSELRGIGSTVPLLLRRAQIPFNKKYQVHIDGGVRIWIPIFPIWR